MKTSLTFTVCISADNRPRPFDAAMDWNNYFSFYSNCKVNRSRYLVVVLGCHCSMSSRFYARLMHLIDPKFASVRMIWLPIRSWMVWIQSRSNLMLTFYRVLEHLSWHPLFSVRPPSNESIHAISINFTIQNEHQYSTKATTDNEIFKKKKQKTIPLETHCVIIGLGRLSLVEPHLYGRHYHLDIHFP